MTERTHQTGSWCSWGRRGSKRSAGPPSSERFPWRRKDQSALEYHIPREKERTDISTARLTKAIDVEPEVSLGAEPTTVPPLPPYQCVELISDESAVVDDVSLQDDEEEEKPQHHVTKVTEDVVEGAVEGRRRISQKAALERSRRPGNTTHLRAPSGWAHRKL